MPINWDSRSELAAEAVAGLNVHSHQWGNYLHTNSVLVRKTGQHHCKLCSGCGRLMCEVGYFDNHKRLVGKLGIIMDEASVEYDADEDVVGDFIQYVKDWANRRVEARYDRADGV